MGLAAIILGLVKALPQAEMVAQQFFELYTAWKRQQNLKDETAKDIRNAAAVGAAGAGLLLCQSCPFANAGAGQHGAAAQSPAVPPGGIGGP